MKAAAQIQSNTRKQPTTQRENGMSTAMCAPIRSIVSPPVLRCFAPLALVSSVVRTSSPNFHGSSSAGSTACCSLPCEAGAENRRAGAAERIAEATGRCIIEAAAGCAARATTDELAATGAAALAS